MGSNVTLHAEGTPVCSFKSSAEVPIRSLRAHFTPTQSGSGDPSPSNIREINGRNELQVWKTGKNLLNQQLYQYTSLVLSFGGNTSGTTDGTLVLAAGTYTFSTNAPAGTIGIYKKGGSFIKVATQSTTATFTITDGTDIGIMMLSFSTEAEALSYNYQLEVGSVATTYEPYKGQVIPITFPVLGKNKCPAATGVEIGQNWTRTQYDYIKDIDGLVPNQQYTLQCTVTKVFSESTQNRLYLYSDGAGSFINLTQETVPITLSVTRISNSDGTIRISLNNSIAVDNERAPYITNIQLELGSTATTYEAYSSNNTVYGGYVDIIEGKLIGQYKYVLLNDADSWTDGSRAFFYKENLDFFSDREIDTSGISGAGYGNTYGLYCTIAPADNNASFYCRWKSATQYNFALRYASDVQDPPTLADIKTLASNNQIGVCYKLASPIEYSIAPAQLDALLNQNHIWSSTNNKIEVDYDLHETRAIQFAKRRIAVNEPHLETKSGAIASFETDLKAPIKQIKCEFAPVQDFNSYGKPWPAGGGKNLFDESLIGSSTSEAFIELQLAPNTVYTFSSNKPSGNGGFQIKTQGTTLESDIVIYENNSGTFTTDATALIKIRYYNGSTSPLSGYWFQLEKGSTVTSYEPYENVCPITGWTGANVYSDPKYGGLVKWNQLVPIKSSDQTGSFSGIDITDNRDGSYTLDGTATRNTNGLQFTLSFVKNHIVLALIDSKLTLTWPNRYSTSKGDRFYVINDSDAGTRSGSLYILSGTTFNNETIRPQVFDLTQMFGETKANEIYAMEQASSGSGVAYFKSLFPNSYYAPDSGTIKTVSAVNNDPYTAVPITFPATKNLFDMNAAVNGYILYGGQSIASPDKENMTSDFIPVTPNETYTYTAFTTTDDAPWTGYSFYSDKDMSSVIALIDGARYVSTTKTPTTITVPNDSTIKYIRIGSRYLMNGGCAQFEAGSTATFYEPYGTIYGGYIDLISGEVWKTHHKILLDGVTTNYKCNRDYSDNTYIVGGIVYLNPDGESDNQFGKSKLYCNKIPLVTPSGTAPNTFPYFKTISAGAQYLRMYMAYTSEHLELDTQQKRIDFCNAYLSNNPTEIVYQLRTPILIAALTPTQLKTLLGTNNIWSNTNGNTSVTYWTH